MYAIILSPAPYESDFNEYEIERFILNFIVYLFILLFITVFNLWRQILVNKTLDLEIRYLPAAPSLR